MLSLYVHFTQLHIAAGTAAVMTFWLTAFLPKGSEKDKKPTSQIYSKKSHKTHVRLGWVYAVAMILLSVSGYAMSLLVLMAPSEIHPTSSAKEAYELSLFLSYLGTCSLVTVTNGIVHARFRGNPEILDHGTMRLINGLALALGLGSLVYGIIHGPILFAGLSLVGISIGGGYFLSLRKKTHWRAEHISSMVGAGIAVHTGLIAGGGSRFLPDWVSQLGVWAWMLPALAGSIGATYWVRKYTKVTP
jgi:hypothetical protein